MSATPDVPRGREKDRRPPSDAELPSSPQDTPTVEFAKKPARGNPLRIDSPPTEDHPGSDPAGIAVPSPLQADVPPELADHPRYRIVGMLGRGGMGMVYKAEHRVMKRFVALKVIASHLVAEPAALERFRREVEAAAKLSHPNIVTAYDAEQAGNCHFLVMELVDGISFDAVLKRKGPLPSVFACDYMRQAALGLQHAHEHGMVHRDIKLQNLMLTRKGQVKILDFGLARFVSESSSAAPLTECGALTGTPDYMSPEQAEDARSADIRADIYSLGCTFYTLLTGELPFPGGSYVEKIVGHLKKEPTPVTAFRKDLPSELIQIVGRMMAKDPTQRFQTPVEVAKALARFRKADGVTAGTARAASMRSTDSADANTAVSLEPRIEGIQTSEESAPPPAALSRSGRCRNRRPSRRDWKPFILVASAVAVIGLLSLGGLLLLIFSRGGASDKKDHAASLSTPVDRRDEEQGQVMIASRDPHLRLAIRRGPKVFGTIGPDSNADMMLPVGEYEVEVVAGAPELRRRTGRLSLLKGDRKVVEVRLEGIIVRDFTTDFPPPPPGLPGGRPPRPFGGPPPNGIK